MKLNVRIYEAGEEKWQLDVSSGKRRIRKHFDGDRFTAEEQRRELLRMNTQGVDVFDYLEREKVTRAAPKQVHPTLRQALTGWIMGQHGSKGGAIRVGTMKSYRSAVERWLFPYTLQDGRIVGDRQIHQVEREMLQAVLDHVRAKKSRELAAQILDPLRTFYAKEVATKGSPVKVDPTLGLQLGPKSESKAEPFTLAEADQIITAAERTSTRVHAFVLVAFQPGLRWAEISGLQKGDADFKAHTLSVMRQWGRYTRTAEPLKTKRSRRTVPMSPELEAALKAHIERTELALPTAWLFAAAGGQPTDASSFRRRVWKPLLKRAGVRFKTFHATRHTAATTMLKRGIPLQVVSRILGHANVGVTDTTYSHLVPTDWAAQVAKAFAREVDHERGMK
jgi:integrase